MNLREATDLVRTTLEPEWNDGTFHLDDRVWENDDLFLFRAGPRELLVDGDLEFARFGGAVPAVVKESGDVVWVPEVRVLEFAGSLRPAR